jgi:predicted DCC family thiol-disulfide oxidoreductase YuxK
MLDTLPAVVYDGECAFCRSQVARIRRMAGEGAFEFVPSRSSELYARFPQLQGENLNSGMRLVEPDGRTHVGADAVYAIARRLRGWRWIAWLYRVPGLHWVARSIYGWIAANRHRLGAVCETEACERPGSPSR